MRPVLVIVLILAILVQLIRPPPADAQGAMLVEDLGVLAQMIISVASLAEMIGLNVRDLQGLATLGPVIQIGTQLVTLSAQLMNIGQQIVAFSDGWVKLGGGSWCQTSEGVAWYTQALQFGRDGSIRVMQIQGILAQMQAMIQTLTNIVVLLPAIGGTVQGMQVNGGILSVISSEIVRLQMAMVPAYQVMVAADLVGQVMRVNAWCTSRNRFGSWGKY